MRVTGRRASGTSLVEVLVVIVVFLVGILAIVQIFPKGIRLLVNSKNSSVATALSRAEVERLKGHADQLPEQIIPVKFDGSNVIVDPDVDPNDLGPRADALDVNGHLYLAGNDLGEWAFLSGANRYRRVVGESSVIPAPRIVGPYYGGVLVLNFGPINYQPLIGANLTVYGNAMRHIPGQPSSAADVADDTFFLEAPDNANASIQLPSGPTDRYYHVSFSGYVSNSRIDYVDTPSVKVEASSPDIYGHYPRKSVLLSSVVSASLQGVEPGSVQVARQFLRVALTDAWTSDPYTFKVLDDKVGSLLFNPAAFNTRVQRVGGGYEPLVARVNYDVLDWRILREEVRINTNGSYAQFQLAVGGLKTSTQSGPDGLKQTGLYLMESPSDGSPSDPKADHFVLIDMVTGGVVYEQDASGKTTVTVNKTTGLVTINSSSSNADPTLDILVAGKSRITVPMEGRALKVLYMVRNEVATQVLQASSKYALVMSRPSAGQCAIGTDTDGNLTPRLYFPKSDNGRRVSLGRFTYIDTGGYVHEIQGQDFVIGYRTNDPIGLPCVDLTEMDSTAKAFQGVRDVKGASVAVRVLWNPDSFHLGSNTDENMKALDVWGRSWRRNTTETYLQQESRR